MSRYSGNNNKIILNSSLAIILWRGPTTAAIKITNCKKVLIFKKGNKKNTYIEVHGMGGMSVTSTSW